MSKDLVAVLQDRVREASTRHRPLVLKGNGTKAFYGRPIHGESLSVAEHQGILDYQPKELVLRARAGTCLDEIEAVLADQGQMLPFEPPHFAQRAAGLDATLGGTIACGLSGPARPYAGAARDLVLGAQVLTGRAEVLRFGGEVMKNVAGYDVSRLMVGALGTLGILLDVSVKVMPIPACTRTLARDCSMREALDRMNHWVGQPLPVTASCFDGERLWVRLSGARQGVAEAAARIGGETVEESVAASFWCDLIREQRHAFFDGDLPLWRLSVPQAAPCLALSGPQLIEWGGAQRWLRSDEDGARTRATVESVGGHAALFRGGDRSGEVFHPLPAGLMRLHRGLKDAFDPHGILNRGRLFAGY